jgi:hypothetical protein
MDHHEKAHFMGEDLLDVFVTLLVYPKDYERVRL